MKAITGDRSLAHALLEAGILAGLAFLAAVPYLYYLTHVAFTELVQERFISTPMRQLLKVDLVLLGVALVICSTAGSLLAERYRLPGLGRWSLLRASLAYLLIGGIGLAAGTYLLFGRFLARRVPGYYPSALSWALLMPLKGAFFEETVARFGMMTLICGLVRRPLIGNMLQALFFTFLTCKSLDFFGLQLEWRLFSIASMISSLVVHLSLGLAYARFGLMACASLHLVVDLKYVVHALIHR